MHREIRDAVKIGRLKESGPRMPQAVVRPNRLIVANWNNPAASDADSATEAHGLYGRMWVLGGTHASL